MCVMALIYMYVEIAHDYNIGKCCQIITKPFHKLVYKLVVHIVWIVLGGR